ncbi:hypothetical protein CLUG_04913 [Clavispora lusitaniae ATCC 42720]|uniref:Uncharacterized protein n=1 Tax=Clavispora lusitaniae (strain ATCC 42720) TaxID=306902 RepID=C4Y9M3_CLAL4|nr:uncharacterized protein CLUG_04913 [Clavispora lusitaniae ATCC 42720]EEQ40784.1 hypothetical protein CLUG_04913 [Clavispora lusitaniae ATCC 42720]
MAVGEVVHDGEDAEGLVFAHEHVQKRCGSAEEHDGHVAEHREGVCVEAQEERPHDRRRCVFVAGGGMRPPACQGEQRAEVAAGGRHAQHGAGQEVGCHGHHQGRHREEKAVVQGQLAEKTAHGGHGRDRQVRQQRSGRARVLAGRQSVQHAGVGYGHSQAVLQGRVREQPLERGQDVELHSQEHLLVVGVAAHDRQLS